MGAPQLRGRGLLLLQPTPFCNLDCTYCYLSRESRNQRSSMSLDTVVRSAELVRDAGLHDQLVVLWHWGEPLILPPSWYRRAQAAIASVLSEIEVEFQFQTNATRISSAWVELFEATDWNTHVSVSLDGPLEVHDCKRLTRRGGGSHTAAMAGVKQLKAAGIPFSCLAVITDSALEAPDRFYQFFRDLGPTGLALNPEELEGANRTSSLASGTHERRYRAFLDRVLELWLPDRPFWMREVSRVERALGQTDRNLQTVAGGVLSVNWRGDFHTFSPELLGTDLPGIGTHLGNVHRDRWATVATSPRLLRLKAEIDRGVSRCARECEYFSVCQGGAPSNKWFEHGSMDATETRYCRLAIQAPLDVLLERLEPTVPSP